MKLPSLVYWQFAFNFLYNDHTLYALVNKLIILTSNSAENTPNSKIKCGTMEYEITFPLNNVYHTIYIKIVYIGLIIIVIKYSLERQSL